MDPPSQTRPWCSAQADPFDSRGELNRRSLSEMPRLLISGPRLLAFLNTRKADFAEAETNFTCINCQPSVTRERLDVSKFTRVAVLNLDDFNQFAGKPFIFREKIPWEQVIPLQTTLSFLVEHS